MAVEVGIFLVGAIIFIGFFSLYFFERTKVPDVILLMLLGVFLTSGLHVLDGKVFASLAPFFGALALIVILFDSGLNLKMTQVLGELSKVTAFSLAVFALTVALIGAGMHLFFGWDILWGLLLGTALGGTAAAIIWPIVSKLPVREETKTLLALESILTSPLCVVTALALMQVILAQSVDFSRVSGDIVAAFSTAGMAGIIAGLLWLGILKHFHGKNFGYMLTLGAVFILYGVTTFLKGNGAIAALVFGLIIGNAPVFAKALKLGDNFDMEESIRHFQKEISFFVRTFFFVYLGIIFSPEALSVTVATMAGAVLVGIILARYLVVKVYERVDARFERYQTLLVGMMPRGLAAAVLASLPLASGVQIPSFAEIVFIIIVLTNVIATVAAFVFEREAPRPVTAFKAGPHVVTQRTAR
ncbi:MAG: cation:proton antiporter [Candidatus Micrarchaeota archaeon]|nr:cation:proton antiporter [Candidatus Micrarchaeota archaeon]